MTRPDRLTQEGSIVSEHAPDASAVVDGPVGAASLKNPATSGPIAAELKALPSIDAPRSPDVDGSIDRAT
jgi:hypothetical protein